MIKVPAFQVRFLLPSHSFLSDIVEGVKAEVGPYS